MRDATHEPAVDPELGRVQREHAREVVPCADVVRVRRVVLGFGMDRTVDPELHSMIVELIRGDQVAGAVVRRLAQDARKRRLGAVEAGPELHRELVGLQRR